MRSRVIPRGVAVLAGDTCAVPASETETVTIEVNASLENENWTIAQSSFYAEKCENHIISSHLYGRQWKTILFRSNYTRYLWARV